MSVPLSGKTIVLGITGSIAAFKAPHIVTRLTVAGANVVVAMTENATQFITPLTFETLSGNEVIVEMFPDEKRGVRPAEEAVSRGERLRHIHLAEAADLVIIAPASANIIGKMANGVADDFLSTELMAVTCPVVVAPAMNVHMMESDAVSANIETLTERGIIFVEAETGRLASGAVGTGRLADPDSIVDVAFKLLAPPQDLTGRRVVVSAGPTREPLDPVRFIGNRSSGRMGYAIAERAVARGADISLVSGPTALRPPDGVKITLVETTVEMLDAVLAESAEADLLVMAAAPADYAPAAPAPSKIKKNRDSLDISLVRTPDILSEFAKSKSEKQAVVGFALETERELEEGRRKLEAKDLDLIVVNNPLLEGAGFDVETNIATILTRSGRQIDTGKLMKRELADMILTEVVVELGWRDERGS
ncbi:bifunctional phosphopantothenoylcysteine decarboxylase/phosphopantothenate--cysteine ligase CoaBC [bacterium]|nr:bifunctional phosphopantothenoylcysteine decarboxylase/phosphopantothenate--cysteine ligase CoaBC [bacterium]